MGGALSNWFGAQLPSLETFSPLPVSLSCSGHDTVSAIRTAEISSQSPTLNSCNTKLPQLVLAASLWSHSTFLKPMNYVVFLATLEWPVKHQMSTFQTFHCPQIFVLTCSVLSGPGAAATAGWRG